MNKFLNYLKKGTIFFFKHHLYIMVILFVIDMITKFTMEAILLNTAGHRIVVIDGFFNFTLVYNPGGFSGMLGDHDLGTFILMLCSILGAVVAIWYLARHFFKMHIMMRIGLYLLIPGCIGNLVDRFLKVIGVKPGVIDFLDFHLPLIGDFPVFNFADSCLTISVIFIVIGLFLEDKDKEKEKKNEELSVEEIYKNSLSSEDSNKEQVNDEELTPEQVNKEEVVNDEASEDEVVNDESNKNEIVDIELNKEEVVNVETNKDKTKNEVNNEEIIKEENKADSNE